MSPRRRTLLCVAATSVARLNQTMTLAEALKNSAAPPAILANQTLLDVPFLDFFGEERVGQLVVARGVADDVAAILAEIYGFPIAQIIPVSYFGWSDDASMEANNCSGFNYRVKVGKTELSAHALGRAVDLNPRCNPYINGDLVLPKGAIYDETAVGTVLAQGIVVRAFERRGWQWGGRWTSLLDYHHFEKPVD